MSLRNTTAADVRGEQAGEHLSLCGQCIDRIVVPEKCSLYMDHHFAIPLPAQRRSAVLVNNGAKITTLEDGFYGWLFDVSPSV